MTTTLNHKNYIVMNTIQHTINTFLNAGYIEGQRLDVM